MFVKQKLNVKNLNEKCKVLRDLESGLSNKEVAANYGVPKNTVSTWVKNKAKPFTALKHCSNKRKKLRESDYKRVDDVPFKWFLSKRSHDIPIDGVFIKEKALQYPKELGFNEFLLREMCPNTELFLVHVFLYSFSPNAEIYEVNLHIQSEYRKIQTRNNSVFGEFSRSVQASDGWLRRWKDR